AIYWRLTHSRPGRSSDPYPVTADFEKAKDEKLAAVDRAAISAAGYAVDGKGWLVRAGQRLSIPVANGGDESDGDDGNSLSSPLLDMEAEGGRDEGGRDEGSRDAGGVVANRTGGRAISHGNLAENASPGVDSLDDGGPNTPSTG